MSEQPQNNPEYLKHHPDAIQDINDAHTLATRVHKLESKRARVVGGMGILADEYLSPHNDSFDSRTRSEVGEEAAIKRLAKAHNVEFRPGMDEKLEVSRAIGHRVVVNALHNAIELQNAGAADDIERKWHEEDPYAPLTKTKTIASVDDLRAAGEVAKAEVAKIDTDLNEVYAGGLNPEEKIKAEIVNSVRDR